MASLRQSDKLRGRSTQGPNSAFTMVSIRWNYAYINISHVRLIVVSLSHTHYWHKHLEYWSNYRDFIVTAVDQDGRGGVDLQTL